MAHVILNLSNNSNPQRLVQTLTQNGLRLPKHLDALGLVVADVPLNKLEQTAALDDVSWISEDQEVRSLSTSTDNTSHIEVTTGASRLLPLDHDGIVGSGVADGGAGNGVGIESATPATALSSDMARPRQSVGCTALLLHRLTRGMT